MWSHSHSEATGCYLPPASISGLVNAAHYQCQVCVCERERMAYFFHDGGGVQIIRSMKWKVTLSSEWFAHSPHSFPAVAHPSQVPLSRPPLSRLRVLHRM